MSIAACTEKYAIAFNHRWHTKMFKFRRLCKLAHIYTVRLLQLPFLTLLRIWNTYRLKLMHNKLVWPTIVLSHCHTFHPLRKGWMHLISNFPQQSEWVSADINGVPVSLVRVNYIPGVLPQIKISPWWKIEFASLQNQIKRKT